MLKPSKSWKSSHWKANLKTSVRWGNRNIIINDIQVHGHEIVLWLHGLSYTIVLPLIAYEKVMPFGSLTPSDLNLEIKCSSFLRKKAEGGENLLF